MSFRALVAGVETRLEVVVRFLAVLELYKQGLIDLDQPGAFGDIEIRWLGEGGHAADLAAIDVYEG
jgi:segregation and condensation protein A